MVKVISAYNFQEQNTYSCTGDISATCLIGSSRLAIAHRNHLIEILTLKQRKNQSEYSSGSPNHRYTDQNENCQPSKIAFPTIDRVEQLHYCSIGNYLITLEEKSLENNDSIKQRFVRVYTNFDIGNSENCFSIPIRARIASKTTPNISCDDHIEVIEIPLYGDINESPNFIACCQMSGTIAISCDYKIYFYEFRRRTNDTNKFQFIDFFEFPFYVQLEFRPLKIEIAEHVVVCLDLETVVAFKIVDLSDVNTEDGTTSNGITTDSSLNHIDRNQYNSYHRNQGRNEHIDFEVAKQFNQVNGIKFQSDLRSSWDHDNDRRYIFFEDRPILVNDVKIFLKNNENISPNDRSYYSIRSLVQLRLHQQPIGSSKSQSIHDEFRCLALKPIYYRIPPASKISDQKIIDDHRLNNDLIIDKSPYAHIMKSNYHGNCVGFSLFISTVSDGYMYQFTNQGKWYTENTKCLAMYPFTAPVIDIVIDNFVIHAITECGIETFSSRIGHKLFSSYYEYPMMSDPYPNETSPLVDVPICVMGICGFFGIKYVSSSKHNLILLTTDNEKNLIANQSRRSIKRAGIAGCIRDDPNSDILDWTIYDLQLPKAEILVDDIENLACIYSTTSPEIFYELMEEAHIIIRLARDLMIPSGDYRVRLNPIDNGDNDDGILEKSYMKTCKMLADFTIQSDRKEIYSQAIAYYSMCKHSIPEIYKEYQNSAHEFDPIGLIYTLKLILSRVGSNKSDAEYLTQSVNGTSGAERNYAEEFFDIFVKFSPGYLAQIALCSSVFREILNEQFYRLYSDAENLTAEEKFCLILCQYHRNETDRALKTFERLERSEIYKILREYWPLILFDNFQSDNYRKSSFSELTESILFVTEISELIEAVADAFIRILIFTHNIDLDFILKLFMNYFAINIGHKGYRTSQRILEIILQAYFYDMYNLNRNMIMATTAPPSTIKCCLNNDNNLSLTPNSADLLQSRLSHSAGLSGASGNEFAIGDRLFNGCDIVSSSTKLILMDQNNSLQLSEDSSTNTTVDSNYEDPEFEAMKILFRMYLGLLKQYSSSLSLTDSPNSPALPDVNGYRLAFIDYMYRNDSLIKSTYCKFHRNILTNSLSAPILPDYDGTIDWAMPFRRPIVFFERREMFLNKMEPLNGCFKPDVDGVLYFDDWDNETSLVLIKIQALLNSGKLDGSLIIDFITFIHSNPNVLGIDSLLAILLPKSEGVELLIHANPRYLLDYANCRLSIPSQWQVLFKRILVKKRELSAETQQDGIELYDRVIDDILQSLVSTKSRCDLLASIPEQEINRSDYPLDKDNSYWKLGKYRTRTQDGIDETNPFELIIREAVAKQRSDALCAMIQSSGRQLNDAVNNYQLNIN